MATVEKLSISLPPELAALVRDAVDQGDYASSSEVVRDALRDWKQLREQRNAALGDLGRIWDQGVDSGKGRFRSIDEIKAEGRRRLTESDAPTS